MKKLSLLIIFFVVQFWSASAQSNLYIPDANKMYLQYPPVEVSNSVYYLTVKYDTSFNNQLITSYYLNRVNKYTAILQKSKLVFSDTLFFYDVNDTKILLGISFLYNKHNKCFTLLGLQHKDSSAYYSNFSRQYPAGIIYTTLDTGLNTIIAQKPVVWFNDSNLSRYYMDDISEIDELDAGKVRLSYYVRDTFYTDIYTYANAVKSMIIDSNGKVLLNAFMGYEPRNYNIARFPKHIYNDRIYHLKSGNYLMQAIFSDLNPVRCFIVMDSNFRMIDSFVSDDTYYGPTIQGKTNYLLSMVYMDKFLVLPKGGLIKSSLMQYVDATTHIIENPYCLAKTFDERAYKFTKVYIAPFTDTSDHQHSGLYGFPNTVYNPYDNLIYSYNASKSTDDFPCITGDENYGQIIAVDTNLNERFIIYIKARPGYCLNPLSVATPDGRKGILVTGIEKAFTNPFEYSLWHPFIYAIDSNSFLGFNDPKAPFVVGDKFVLYPSPASNDITIENMTNKGSSYVIYDMLGKMITKNTVTTSLQKVDVSHFASGHYNVIVSDESGARTTLRFMR